MEEQPSSSIGSGPLGPLRRASTTLINANPQLGMWQATGTALAHVPDITELRGAETGGNILFNSQGRSARTAVRRSDGELVPLGSVSKPRSETFPRDANAGAGGDEPAFTLPRRQTLLEMQSSEPKAGWGVTIRNGLKAYWSFLKTPIGVMITIYFLNIVAWGAMLFFLLLKAAPAMNYPTADDDNSPRKKWLEIDSQILNALFCVTGFGLAPWRFRDFYRYMRVVFVRDRTAMSKLAAQNSGWFRTPDWYNHHEDAEDGASGSDHLARTPTFTGSKAPPTAMWKLGLVISMMVWNTLFQVVLSYFMWAYNRFDRPTWATGTFIGLGCGVSAVAGFVSWWEGRKVKKIEGPDVIVVKDVEA
ncbi:hypothetical protein PFICI_14781 [Pestalotiopsis fici W106-1]|uniref:Uncharacterized protein n=1 Tax=Pestalotiopsis fici (strain W106-1 / CGMCC3.15140) TaxID=1229662 RepID=W3WIU0_PESFW|nr:uncharacterized protein PFICI_14781 [Pestalotiopsis fici W106-1]ETS73835.1 hypothetical protein PFICI_14781 [Pestalotiopsis fici W106-1]